MGAKGDADETVKPDSSGVAPPGSPGAPALTEKELHWLGAIAGTERLGKIDGHLLIRLLREHEKLRTRIQDVAFLYEEEKEKE